MTKVECIRTNMGLRTFVSNGKLSKAVHEIVLYDEDGAWITNYTNENEFSLTLKRKINLSRYQSSPDYNNKDGFMCRRLNTIHEMLNYLFVHLDNVPEYARRFLEFWEFYKIVPGAITSTFSLEGCTFRRIVGNPVIEDAENSLSNCLDNMRRFNARSITLYKDQQDCVELATDALNRAIKRLSFQKERIENMGIVELILENGADRPISDNDYNNISSLEWK